CSSTAVARRCQTVMQRQALLLSLASCLMVLALGQSFIKDNETHRAEAPRHLLQVPGSNQATSLERQLEHTFAAKEAQADWVHRHQDADHFDSIPASTASLVAMVLLVASSVLVACLVYILVHQPIKLRREVALRTQELTHINTVLATEIAERRRAETAL